MDEREYQSRVTECVPALYRAARSILFNEQDCADAVQEAVFQGWVKRAQLRDSARLKPWLTRIVINECRNLQRGAYRQLRAVEATIAELRAPAPPEATNLEAALSELDEKYRLPLVLHYAEGYSTKEIAGMLNIPEGRLRQRMHVARRKLERRLMGDAGE